MSLSRSLDHRFADGITPSRVHPIFCPTPAPAIQMMSYVRPADAEGSEVEELQGLDNLGFDFEQFLRPKIPWKPSWSLEGVFSSHGYHYNGRAFTSSERLFRCQRVSDNEPCLIKIIDSNEAAINRIILTNSAQPHPVLEVLDVQGTDDVLLVMNKWGDQWCRQDLPDPDGVMYKLSDQLARLHSLGVAHLDIHDKNVVAKNDVYILLDFGSSILWDGRGPKPLVQDIRTALWSVVPDMKRGTPFDPFPFDVWTLAELFSHIMETCKYKNTEIQRLITHMKAEDPLQRPIAVDVRSRLGDILRKGKADHE